MAEGVTPLGYMLNILREPEPADLDVRQRLLWREMRFEAAKAAAPYCHPRLTSVRHAGPDGGALPLTGASHPVVIVVREGGGDKLPPEAQAHLERVLAAPKS